MRCLIYQLASDRLHNVQMGIDAFLWRLPETETALARGPGEPFRGYVEISGQRERKLLYWGFEPGWVGEGGLQRLGKGPWPWVAAEKAPASRIFAQPLRYQRCLVPADVLFVGNPHGLWLRPATGVLFLGGVWDQASFAVLTVATPDRLAGRIGPRMPLAIDPNDYDAWLSERVTHIEDVRRMITAGRADWIPSNDQVAMLPVAERIPLR